jgi:D-xylose reductase
MEYAPVPMRETWEAMQEQHARGKARNIGVCNLNANGVRDLLSYATVRPAVLQVSTNNHDLDRCCCCCCPQ